jgi:hypothetical protein
MRGGAGSWKSPPISVTGRHDSFPFFSLSYVRFYSSRVTSRNRRCGLTGLRGSGLGETGGVHVLRIVPMLWRIAGRTRMGSCGLSPSQRTRSDDGD